MRNRIRKPGRLPLFLPYTRLLVDGMCVHWEGILLVVGKPASDPVLRADSLALPQVSLLDHYRHGDYSLGESQLSPYRLMRPIRFLEDDPQPI